jgi:peptide-methionine (S)-S-oxide reductase
MKSIIFLILLLFTQSCQSQKKETAMNEIKEPIAMNVEQGLELATFAGGCFWCTEAVFLEIEGVQKVVSGYIGGTIKNPAYREVTTGRTGHAEGIQITFDPKIISYGELLEIFFATHDPTTLNRQGNDVGTQYRSEIFYYNDDQKSLAEGYIELMTTEKTFDSPIVTKVTPASVFYVAEDYHQNYYNYNQDQQYCYYVITPKINKVRTKFKSKLKK